MNGTQFIENLYIHGASKPGLDRVRDLLSRLGNPQAKVQCVHVAGTNGKGSTCAFLERILRTSGYSTGAFLSPHLESIREYIMLGGRVCPEDLFEKYATRIMEECMVTAQSGGDTPTFFEAMVALAFHTFFMEGVDIAVIETGMGGLFDATNVITPILSIITPIDFDHTAILGKNIEQIAAHKAGVIKPGCPVVVAQQGDKSAHTVILDKAYELNSRVVDAAACNIAVESSTLDGVTFSMECMGENQLYKIPLPGRHQSKNAATAVLSARTLVELGFSGINNDSIVSGLAATEWPGRLEVIRGEVNFLLDGTHNPQGAKALAEFIAELLSAQRVILVCGMLRTKDADAISRQFVRFADEVILTTPDNVLARNPQELKPVFEEMGAKVQVEEDAGRAVKLAARLAGKGSWVVVSGSLFLIACASRAISAENYDFPPRS